jgi:hypothetical protein
MIGPRNRSSVEITRMTSRHDWRFGRFAILMLVLTAPVAAMAQDATKPQLTEDQKQKAREHNEKATRFYNVGKFAEAIDEYENVYLISADPNMLFNIAQCHRQNNQPEEALRFYNNYLRNAPNAKNRAAVERQIAEMEKLVEERRKQGISPPVVPPTTTGTNPPTVPPGPGDPTPPTVPPTTVPPTTAPPPVGADPVPPIGPVAPPPPDERPRPSRTLPLGLIIGGGALIVTSAVFGAVAVSKAKDVEEASERGGVFDQRVKKLEKDGKAASAGAVITGLAGIGLGVTGVILWIKRAPGDEPETAAPAQAALFPLAGPGFAGAGARMTF